MIDQVTVFLENSKGRLAALTRVLGDAEISMHTLTIAETTDYGVVRIITDSPARAAETLDAAGYRAKITPVVAIRVPDEAGGLASLLEAFDEAGINVEYAYCFSTNKGYAIDILRVDDTQRVAAVVLKAGYHLLEPGDLYAY
ncbi:MAG: ACT domain-containing protein [Coriobacteriales bacterium]|jgi:hypothetical protein|nr:ACT domain-containing protein [Coriobacteriales bacterium]